MVLPVHRCVNWGPGGWGACTFWELGNGGGNMKAGFSLGPSPVSCSWAALLWKRKWAEAWEVPFSPPAGSSSVPLTLSMSPPLGPGSVVLLQETFSNSSGSHQPCPSLHSGVLWALSHPAWASLRSPLFMPLASVTEAHTGKPRTRGCPVCNASCRSPPRAGERLLLPGSIKGALATDARSCPSSLWEQQG